jgi:hypothetical protein
MGMGPEFFFNRSRQIMQKLLDKSAPYLLHSYQANNQFEKKKKNFYTFFEKFPNELRTD